MRAFDLVKTKLAFMEQQKWMNKRKHYKMAMTLRCCQYDLSYSLTEAKGLVDDLQNKGQETVFNDKYSPFPCRYG